MTAFIEVEEMVTGWPPPEGGCPAWCEVSSTHRPERDAEDRIHWGTEQQIPLSLEPHVELCDAGCEPEYFTACLSQGQEERRPRVNLGKGDDLGVTLTFGEAAGLAHALLSAMCDAHPEVKP